MKLPWVSRREYDEAIALLGRYERTLADAMRNLEHATRQTERLIVVMESTLKAPAVTEVKPLPMAQVSRDDLSDAIELSAGSDRGLARHLTRWAKQQQLDGAREHDIIQSIIHWHSATEWDGDEASGPDDFR